MMCRGKKEQTARLGTETAPWKISAFLTSIEVYPFADPEAAVAEVQAEGLIKSTGRIYCQDYCAVQPGKSHSYGNISIPCARPRRWTHRSLISNPENGSEGSLYSPRELPPILLGTSSFTSSRLGGNILSEGNASSDYLSFDADHFHTVEVYSTFYAVPGPVDFGGALGAGMFPESGR